VRFYEKRAQCAAARGGLGLAYTFEPYVAEQLRDGTLEVVLEPYAATVSGFFLYYPSRAQSSPALRLFVDVAKEVLLRRR
jgi:DNA-binding transcriptional LysR family regulator